MNASGRSCADRLCGRAARHPAPHPTAEIEREDFKQDGAATAFGDEPDSGPRTSLGAGRWRWQTDSGAHLTAAIRQLERRLRRRPTDSRRVHPACSAGDAGPAGRAHRRIRASSALFTPTPSSATPVRRNNPGPSNSAGHAPSPMGSSTRRSCGIARLEDEINGFAPTPGPVHGRQQRSQQSPGRNRDPRDDPTRRGHDDPQSRPAGRNEPGDRPSAKSARATRRASISSMRSASGHSRCADLAYVGDCASRLRPFPRLTSRWTTT